MSIVSAYSLLCTYNEVRYQTISPALGGYRRRRRWAHTHLSQQCQYGTAMNAMCACTGRWLALLLAQLGQQWRRAAAKRMPEARGDIREIVGQPVFIPLYKLFLNYGKIFRLSFGPKSFVVISDAAFAKQILYTNASKYSKGLLR